MTDIKKNTEKQIKIMQAYLNGETIEIYRYVGYGTEYSGIVNDNTNWNWERYNYIRAAKLYLCNNIKDLVGKTLKHKKSGDIYLVIGYDKSSNQVIVMDENIQISYNSNELIDNFYSSNGGIIGEHQE